MAVLRGAVVMLEQSTESLVTRDPSLADRARSVDQLVVEALMVPLAVIVTSVLGAGLSEGAFSEEDELVEALALDRQDEAFGERVQVRAAAGQSHVGDAGVLEYPKELLCELLVPIVDEEPFVS